MSLALVSCCEITKDGKLLYKSYLNVTVASKVILSNYRSEVKKTLNPENKFTYTGASVYEAVILKAKVQREESEKKLQLRGHFCFFFKRASERL